MFSPFRATDGVQMSRAREPSHRKRASRQPGIVGNIPWPMADIRSAGILELCAGTVTCLLQFHYVSRRPQFCQHLLKFVLVIRIIRCPTTLKTGSRAALLHLPSMHAHMHHSIISSGEKFCTPLMVAQFQQELSWLGRQASHLLIIMSTKVPVAQHMMSRHPGSSGGIWIRCPRATAHINTRLPLQQSQEEDHINGKQDRLPIDADHTHHHKVNG